MNGRINTVEERCVVPATSTEPRTRSWKAVSDDPNSTEAIRFRNETLTAAHGDPVPDRIAYIQNLCRGKRVLDVGVVDHTVRSGQSLHRSVASVASYCLGTDILPEAVKTLQARGLNVRLWDVTSEPLDEQFDVMICGEVIEHLGNPGGLFAAAARTLSPAGRMVLTTPNPFYMFRTRDNLRGRCFDSVDHVTMIFPSGVAEFAEREGLRLDRYRGVSVGPAVTLRAKLALTTLRLLFGRVLSPDVGCYTMIYECVKPA